MIVAKYRFLLTLGLFQLSFRGCAWFNGKYVTFVIPKQIIGTFLHLHMDVGLNTGTVKITSAQHVHPNNDLRN